MDFDVDPRGPRVAQIDTQGSPERTVTGIAAWAARLPVLMTLPMLLLVMPGTVILVAGPTVLAAMKAVRAVGGG